MTGSVSQMARDLGNGEMEVVGRDSLEKAQEAEYRTVNIPGFGACRARSLTEQEKTEIELGFHEAGIDATLSEVRPHLIVHQWVDGEGKRILSDDELEVAKGLNGRIAGPLGKLCMELAGYLETDFEEAAGNLPETLGE